MNINLLLLFLSFLCFFWLRIIITDLQKVGIYIHLNVPTYVGTVNSPNYPDADEKYLMLLHGKKNSQLTKLSMFDRYPLWVVKDALICISHVNHEDYSQPLIITYDLQNNKKVGF